MVQRPRRYDTTEDFVRATLLKIIRRPGEFVRTALITEKDGSHTLWFECDDVPSQAAPR